MKKIFFLVLICCIAVFFCTRFIFPKQKLSTNNSPSPLPTPTLSTSTITWNDISYGFEYFEVMDISKLTLIANFTQKKSSELILKENDCQYAINGGFYDTNNKPLGLFINSTLKTPTIANELVNGYIAITNRPIITFDLAQNPTVALQTGPMLMMDGKKLKLAIVKDEYARRMIAGISSKDTMIFMTIFIPETKVQGPKLADLPDILERSNLDMVSAINLDGGNASMFKNKNVFIQEISSVGSLFCYH